VSRVVVEFKTDGAAFRTDADDPGALDTSEVAGLLRVVADRISHGRVSGPVVDSWGNAVGAFAVEEDR
jgi:hypothetical protein